MTYDVAIVGAGAAGAVLAARLSEDPRRKVLLLEAGPDFRSVDDLPEVLRVENGSVRTVAASKFAGFAWQYEGVLTERRAATPILRGRVVGGSTAINGSLWQRGLPEDYDAWGSDLWSYEAVLPYFRRVEHDLDYADELRGGDGPIPVRRVPKDQLPRSQRGFYDACLELGFPEKLDLIRPEGHGVGPIPRNSIDGVRMSTALTYLLPCRDRTNLTVQADTRVTRVQFEGSRATGLELRHGGRRTTVRAKEIVLAAGAIASPHLLTVSGVGPAGRLRELGVPVVRDLPGVGGNLTDHTVASMLLRMRPGVADPADGRLSVALICTAPGSPDRNDLHLMLGGAGDLGIDDIPAAELLRLTVLLQRPQSVGHLEIASADPLVEPRVVYRYLDAARDRQRLRDAMRLCARLAETEALREVIAERVAPLTEVLESDERLDRWLADTIHTTAHSCGTCKLGDATDPLAVVDDHGRVHGLEAVRVADLSIVPYVIRGATNATASMIGERIAALY